MLNKNSDTAISEIKDNLLRKIIEYIGDNKLIDSPNPSIHSISLMLDDNSKQYSDSSSFLDSTFDSIFQCQFDCKFLWSDRAGNLDIAAFGICRRIPFNSLSDYTAKHRIYGGMRFDSDNNNGNIWNNFPAAFFFIPKFEAVNHNNFTLTYNFAFGAGDTQESIISNAERELSILFAASEKTNSVFQIAEIKHKPDKEEWKANIEQATGWIEPGRCRKIVLARETAITFDKPPDGIEIYRKLKQDNPDSFTFYFAVGKDSAFMGASPERLYKRCGNAIHCDALAGTIKRGGNEYEDKMLGNQLLNSIKDVNEQALVAEYLSAKLKEICSGNSHAGPLQVRKSGQVQHLFNSISGELSRGISDSDIIECLHPTPAVAGVPQKEALEFIRRVEPFGRGWYAGPIGWISKDEAEFAVAIRSGLIQNDKLYLYSGAGIIEGSSPEAEWEEINHKLSNFMRIFDGKSVLSG